MRHDVFMKHRICHVPKLLMYVFPLYMTMFSAKTSPSDFIIRDLLFTLKFLVQVSGSHLISKYVNEKD